jgi:next-to-BRCA1 protein 1
MDHVMLKVKVALPESFKFVSPFPKWVFADQQSQSQEPLRAKAHFVRDVTVPDGSALRPGQRVLKTWSMKNSGKVYWPRDTKLVFVGGQLSPIESEEQPLIPLAAPGEVVDVSVRLQMPDKPGRYTGYYRLSYGEGARFGNRIWIDVLVSDSASTSAKGVFDKALEVVTNIFKGEKPKESKKTEEEKPKEAPAKFEFESELLQLKAMGFKDEHKLKELLLSSKGNVQRVANQLLTE